MCDDSPPVFISHHPKLIKIITETFFLKTVKRNGLYVPQFRAICKCTHAISVVIVSLLSTACDGSSKTWSLLVLACSQELLFTLKNTTSSAI